GIERLCDEIVSACAHRLQIISLALQSGQQHYIAIASCFGSPNEATKFEPISFRHQPIGDYEREVVFLKDFPCFFSVLGCDDIVALQFQKNLKHIAGIKVVFNNQDAHNAITELIALSVSRSIRAFPFLESPSGSRSCRIDNLSAADEARRYQAKA